MEGRAPCVVIMSNFPQSNKLSSTCSKHASSACSSTSPYICTYDRMETKELSNSGLPCFRMLTCHLNEPSHRILPQTSYRVFQMLMSDALSIVRSAVRTTQFSDRPDFVDASAQVLTVNSWVGFQAALEIALTPKKVGFLGRANTGPSNPI